MKTFITLLVTTNLFASINKISHFSNSLEERYMIQSKHLENVARKINIKKPNAFQRWHMNRSGAEATYNDKTKTIVLKDNYWIGNRLRNHKEFQTPDMFDLRTTTTFHELAHADYDVFISRSNLEIKTLLNNKLIPWFRRNFPSFSSKIATHELFGYTAGDAIMNVSSEINTIFMNHGLYYSKKKCFGDKGLIKIAANLGITKDNIEFKNTDTRNLPYYKKVVPTATFVKGKVLDLTKTPLPESYKVGLYDYFVYQYDFPKNRQDLIDRLNNSKQLEYLKECMLKVLK